MRGAGDELDELAAGLNDMLERLERSIAGLRHAGDAIAHDLRSPLTRLRARMEAALIEVEAGGATPKPALRQALDDADGVLRTFGAVLAIARLEAAAAAPDQPLFDPAELAADVAELYEPVCEEKGLDFKAELAPGLGGARQPRVHRPGARQPAGQRGEIHPGGGAVMLRARRRSSGEVELSVTDTGPGVPEDDRERVVERFVRLENSRNEPGAGLGLSLVAAVAEAHGGRLELDEGPGHGRRQGPGPARRPGAAEGGVTRARARRATCPLRAGGRRRRRRARSTPADPGRPSARRAAIARSWPALAPVFAASPYLARPGRAGPRPWRACWRTIPQAALAGADRGGEGGRRAGIAERRRGAAPAEGRAASARRRSAISAGSGTWTR